jgi:putative tricarboxylic transport membrane protein
MILANIFLLIFGLLGIRLFVKVLQVQKIILIPIILVLCIVGSYALGNSVFDVWTMIVTGIIGYFLQRHGFPPSPIILALILGPMMEANFRRSLSMSQGDLSIFLTRPITITLLLLALLTLLSPVIRVYWRRFFPRA